MMIPDYVKYLTVSQNEDSTYNIVYIADMTDGDTIYEDCEIMLPKSVSFNDDIVTFPYYSDNEEEIIVTITIPGDYK